MEDLKLNESLSRKYNDVKGCRSLLSVCLVYASTLSYPFILPWRLYYAHEVDQLEG